MANASHDRPMPSPFTGFADPTLRFFHELDSHQDRAWFIEHKALYEDQWARPLAALLAQVSPRIARFYKGLPLRDPKVFRIQRDVRFSLDKSPYKTHVSGLLALRGGSEAVESPAALYVQLGTESFVGAGVYSMAPPLLRAWREMLLDPRRGAAMARLVDDLVARGFSVSAMDSLKTAPRGVDPEHPRIALLKQKGLALGFPAIPPGMIGTAGFADWLVDRAEETAPAVQKLARLLDA
ncbi:MAG: DUF2461 domain-containing protein [Deltaproteobacteria bacterium]|nr:DUF2461 domain-containing protein [Deltaproteobacteria bacterium]